MSRESFMRTCAACARLGMSTYDTIYGSFDQIQGSSDRQTGCFDRVQESFVECRQLAGSLKLYVSFAEYSHFYRALLQKAPTILRSLLIVANP